MLPNEEKYQKLLLKVAGRIFGKGFLGQVWASIASHSWGLRKDTALPKLFSVLLREAHSHRQVLRGIKLGLTNGKLTWLADDPGFPRSDWGDSGLPTPKTGCQPIIWPQFSQKVYENERNWTGRPGNPLPSYFWIRQSSYLIIPIKCQITESFKIGITFIFLIQHRIHTETE